MTAEDVCREVVARIEKKVREDSSIIELQKRANDLAKRLNQVQADIQQRAEKLARDEWVTELRKYEPCGYVS